MTMDVLRKIKPYIYNIQANRLQIHPGTEIENQARRMGILPSNFSWFDPDSKYHTIPFWKSLMTDEEIAKCAGELRRYQFRLHHSRISDLNPRKRLLKSVIIPITKNSTVMGAIYKFPAIRTFLASLVDRLFASTG